MVGARRPTLADWIDYIESDIPEWFYFEDTRIGIGDFVIPNELDTDVKALRKFDLTRPISVSGFICSENDRTYQIDLASDFESWVKKNNFETIVVQVEKGDNATELKKYLRESGYKFT